jgi:TonB family protein
MRTAVGALVLALAVVGARGQEAPSQDGPVPNGDGDVAAAAGYGPGGGYRMEQGMTAPKIVNVVAAVYPEDWPAGSGIRRSLLSMIVNEDGVPLFIHVVRSAGDAFDAAAIYAVRQSKFEPGVREQKKVPIRMVARVTFTPDHALALPELLHATYRGMGKDPVADYPPKLLYKVEAQFSEEARRKKISGTVTVSLLVTETGAVSDVKVERGAGYGLDQKAVEAVSQYRFAPAMKDGEPIAQHIQVMVNFQIFR